MVREILLAERESLVTIDDFLDTYLNPYSPHAKNAVNFLAGQGVLPLTYTNPKLQDLNILVAWLFWSGAITSNYKASMNVPPEYHGGIEGIAKNLDFGFRQEIGNTLTFSERGYQYARLLTKLGIPLSSGSREDYDKKTKHAIDLPEYVIFLANHYPNFRREDKVAVKRILADQCKVLMWSRGRWNKGRMYIIPLIANKVVAVDPESSISQSQQNVENLAQQVLKMFNAVFPRIGLDYSSVHIYYNKSQKNHFASISFRQENVFNAMGYGLFEITVNRQYR